MAEWQVITLNVDSNGVWTQASAELIAGYTDGTVQMAYADLGIELISISYWYVSFSIDTTQTDVPVLTWDGCDYGMVGWSRGGYYNPGSFSLITLDETAVYFTNVAGGDGGCGGTWNVLEGNGFVAFKQTSKSSSSDNACFVYDTAKSLVTGDTVSALIDASRIFSLGDNVNATNNAMSPTVVTQTDGSAYVEIMNLIMFNNEPVSEVYQADHVYFPVWDYDSYREKNVRINGIKFNRMGYTFMYVPTE